jgi:hypothetical protein
VRIVTLILAGALLAGCTKEQYLAVEDVLARLDGGQGPYLTSTQIRQPVVCRPLGGTMYCQ